VVATGCRRWTARQPPSRTALVRNPRLSGVIHRLLAVHRFLDLSQSNSPPPPLAVRTAARSEEATADGERPWRRLGFSGEEKGREEDAGVGGGQDQHDPSLPMDKQRRLHDRGAPYLARKGGPPRSGVAVLSTDAESK
jgi:hypothetical protein